MSSNRKSYIVRNSIAPYKKPSNSIVTRNTRMISLQKPSFFNKIKSFFQNQQGQDKESKDDSQSTSNKTRRSESSFHVPGGFYDSNVAAESSAILSRALSSHTANSTFDGLKNTGGDEEEDEEEEDPNVSNAKLASFFKEKGDRPLTEMEMEGVISLMKKSRSVSSTPYGSRIISESKHAPTSKVLRTTSESIATPLRATSYTPRFEDTSQGNHSIRSTRSSVTRRIFDYSKVPSPYRTTVYKYSAGSLPIKDTNTVLSQHIETKNKVTRNRAQQPKKLSNTASALMSILDGDSSKNGQTNVSVTSSIANPYASHIARVRKSKPTETSSSHPPSTPAKSTNNNPTDSQPAVSVSLPSQSQTQQKPQNTNTSTEKELSTTTDEANNTTNANVNGSSQYKPVVSSSLRQTVTAEKSPVKQAADKQPESKPQLATQIFGNGNNKNSDFSFTFQKPVPFNMPTLPNSTTPAATDNGNGKTHTFSFTKTEPVAPVEPVEPTKPKETKSTENTKPALQFSFGEAPKSNVDPNTIDKRKVEQYKSMFAF